MSKGLGKPGRKGDDETFLWASYNGAESCGGTPGGLKNRLAPHVPWFFRDAEHPEGPAKGCVTALGLPAGREGGF